jgi:hypothetical protein
LTRARHQRDHCERNTPARRSTTAVNSVRARY